MRLSSACAYLVASVLLLSGCGNSTHNPIVCAGTDTCVLQNFVYATTAASQVLVFPVTQNGALQTPTSLPGPAISGGTIAISPPSRELFVGDHVLNELSAFLLSGNQYLAAPGSPYPGGSGPASLESVATTPNGKFVYVVGLSGTISGFSIMPNGSLSVISGSPFPVAPNSVDAVIDASSKFLFAVSPSSVSAFTINPATGALSAVGQAVPLPGSTLPSPGFSATTPVGNFIYVPLTGANSVAAFSFDMTTGALTAVPGSPFPVGSMPQTLTATSTTIYVMDALDAKISALAWDKTTGALAEIGGSPFDAQGASGGEMATLVGRYLYVTRVNNLISPNSDAIVGFTIDSSGALTPLAGSPFPSNVPLWGGLATSAAPQ
jgi:6-phosphogluconolactonase (cycloisomerase 2 family)